VGHDIESLCAASAAIPEVVQSEGEGAVRLASAVSGSDLARGCRGASNRRRHRHANRVTKECTAGTTFDFALSAAKQSRSKS